jgi:hypothetical protein
MSINDVPDRSDPELNILLMRGFLERNFVHYNMHLAESPKLNNMHL